MREDRIAEQFRGSETGGSGLILPSRVPVLSALTETWTRPGSDIAILTGAAGTGKSWLWRSAVTQTRTIRTDLRWIWIPKWPESRGPDLLRALLGGLDDSGLALKMSLERLYVLTERRFRELHEDGFGVRIVVEEAHHLDFRSYESLRILTERLRPIGLDLTILLVGRTTLLHRFRRFAADARPGGWHLPHISLPETLELLDWFAGSKRSWTRAEADWIHREALGNPRRIVRWAESIPAGNGDADKPMVKPGFGHETGSPKPPVTGSALLTEPLIPTRPPLAESEGVIEVGYEDDFDAPPRLPADWIADGQTILTQDDTLETSQEIAGENDLAERRLKYRVESGEGFAPYGLGSGRTENSPGKTSN